VLGTAAYISPEQAAGEQASPASDVYSFGVILFRMLTGRLPFESDQPLELVAMHRDLDAPALDEIRPDVPPRLESLAMAALARDLHDRPADGSALLAELGGAGEIDATQVLTPPPAGRGDTSRRGQARSRVPRAALLAGFIAAGAAGVGLAYLATRGESSATTPTASTPARTRATTSTTTSQQSQSTSTTTTTTTSAPTTTHQTPPPPPPPTSTTTPTVPTTTDTLPVTTTTTVDTTVPVSP
jgi:serine/threonine-protein kinase